ncbi:MAG: hypothetical protein ACXVB9_09670 [Bdellovibrionota bacterium]
MRFLVAAVFVAALCASATVFAAGYAVHGTYFDYGPASTSAANSVAVPRRIPAVLYVSLHNREARIRLSAPGARCVPEFGASGYVGPAYADFLGALAVHVEQKSDCVHNANDARLLLRFTRFPPRRVLTALMLDQEARGQSGAVLFQGN